LKVETDGIVSDFLGHLENRRLDLGQNTGCHLLVLFSINDFEDTPRNELSYSIRVLCLTEMKVFVDAVLIFFIELSAFDWLHNLKGNGLAELSVAVRSVPTLYQIEEIVEVDAVLNPGLQI